jgi:hypothetical protein
VKLRPIVFGVLALFVSSPVLGQNQQYEWPLGSSETYAHAGGGYGYDSYEWTISASPTNPFINLGVPPASQPFALYLWMTCTQNLYQEWYGAEMRIEDQATNVTLSSFTPRNGITSIGTFPDILVIESGCPLGPFLVGAIECVSTGLASGQLCIVRSQQNDLRATVDCSLDPVLWPMKTTGFGFGAAATCVDPDVFCDKPSALEAGSWGRTKASYR